MEATKEQLDPKEVLEQRKQELEERFNALEERLKDEKYKDQGYDADSSFTMEGQLLSEILNMHAAFKSTLVKVQQNLAAAYDVIDSLIDANADLSLKLMNKHLDNVDNGITKISK